MRKDTEFGIIVNIVDDEHQFCVWPMHRPLPFGWFFTGLTGSQAEMEVSLRQQFVETIPATHITRDKWSRASQWADTEGGAG